MNVRALGSGSIGIRALLGTKRARSEPAWFQAARSTPFASIVDGKVGTPKGLTLRRLAFAAPNDKVMARHVRYR